jgi:tetratricopeptide (TPR) repeat protein
VTTPADDITRRALSAHQAGRLDEAADLYRQAISENFQNDVAHHNLGLIASLRHDYTLAKSAMEESIRIRPKLAFYRSNFSTVLRNMGETKRAIAEAETALAQDPRLAAAWNNKALAHLDLGDDDAAAEGFTKAIALDPKYAEAMSNFALLRLRQGRYQEGERLAIKAVKARPNHLGSILALGDCLEGQLRYNGAMAAYQRAKSIAPSSADVYIRLGRLLSETGDAAGAREHLEHAVKLSPGNPATHHELGLYLRLHGYLDEAAAHFREALRINPRNFSTYAILARTVRHDSPDSPEYLAMLSAYESVPPESPARSHLAFGLGEALESMGNHKLAFEKFLEANRIRRASSDYSEAMQTQRLDAVRQVFTPEFISRHANAGSDSRAPIFILGMPRSGTTLTEQMVSTSSNVFGAGELNLVTVASGQTFGFHTFLDIPSYLKPGANLDFAKAAEIYLEWLPDEAKGKPRFTDKLPHNFWNIGLIHLMFPNAKIVHINRSPMDNCLSMFKATFGAVGLNYSYDLSELGRYYNIYRGVMQHWRHVLPGAFHELHYERLVEDPEAETRKLFDYLELEWTPSVLDFHQSRRDIKTASAAQVRRPIYKTSVNLSERYGDLLDPLRAALDEWKDDESSAS